MSNISGTLLERGKGARVRIEYFTPRKRARKADLTDEEADRFADQINAEGVSPRK